MNKSISHRLVSAWREGRLGAALARRLGLSSNSSRVRWHGAENQAQAVATLLEWGRGMAASDQERVLVIGPDDPLRRRLEAQLRRHRVASEIRAIDELEGFKPADNLAGVLCTATSVREQTTIARVISAHPYLSRLRFEYVGGLDPAQQQFVELDEYRDTFFISPVLRDKPDPYSIYTESLQYFEQKCGLRDYLDLYQVLAEIVRRKVPGDIAEFGSYKGHSGWLIARSLQALGSDKHLWMFDMFEAFPEEPLGVDQFWSATHEVDFSQVRDKLAHFERVKLVKGDFTQTLGESSLERLALAYIDCDSFRATRFLLERLPDNYLATGGTMICEDYGHPALLGNRVAVHEVMDGRVDFVRQFSQFSGLYMFTKMGAVAT